MEFDGFDWDDGNRDKCQKHGVSIGEIERLFERTVLVGPDVAHSSAEQRFRAIGAASTGRRVFACYHLAHEGPAAVSAANQRPLHGGEEVASHEKEIP